MTIGAWLAARDPRPPELLRRRIAELLGSDLACPAEETAPRCLAAGERLLAALLGANSTARTSALELLAADALVTYAFEAASERPATIGELARGALYRIGAVASSAPAGAPAASPVSSL